MLGGGGIGEHEASAVTGGGGIEEQPCAVLGGGGISASRPAPRSARLPALLRTGAWQVTSPKPPKPAGSPPAWSHRTVTAWRLYGTRDPLIWGGDHDLMSVSE